MKTINIIGFDHAAVITTPRRQLLILLSSEFDRRRGRGLLVLCMFAKLLSTPVACHQACPTQPIAAWRLLRVTRQLLN